MDSVNSGKPLRSSVANAAVDPLSDVMSLLRPRGFMSGGIDAGGDWSIQFPKHEGARCFFILSGRCWLKVAGVSEPVLLASGDYVVLPHERPFRVASDLSLEPVDAWTVITEPLDGRIKTWNGGGNCLGVSAYFTFSSRHAVLLLGVLPPIVHIRKRSDRAAMRWYPKRMMRELREPQAGGTLLGQHLAHMMLIEALRLTMAEGVKGGVGWLFALADKQIGSAMHAMHGNPASRWTLQELAEHAGMSRSVFAVRFKNRVGMTAMEYLTRWRMLCAGDRLVHSHETVASIALALGYESEGSFGTAFKRVMGCSPRQYGHRMVRSGEGSF